MQLARWQVLLPGPDLGVDGGGQGAVGGAPAPQPPLLVRLGIAVDAGDLVEDLGHPAGVGGDAGAGPDREDLQLGVADQGGDRPGERGVADDDDPLDILVLCRERIVPGALVRARIIGVLTMTGASLAGAERGG